MSPQPLSSLYIQAGWRWLSRYYADVAPINGVILSSGDQDVDVAVDVIPIKSENAPPTFA